MEFEIKNVISKSDEHPKFDNVIVFECGDVSYDDFFQKFLQQNVPCVIKNITRNWEASSKWIQNNSPNLDYLQEKYGDSSVRVYYCSEKFFNSQKSKEDTLNNYIEYWKNERYDLNLYLKDWHLKLQYEDDNFYEVPIYFASDWLNEYCLALEDDDYRFVYMGPSNSWTPLHADVFTSYSWSANICGQKKWKFLPPGEENLLKDEFGELPHDIGDVREPINFLEVIQNPGEAIFVPSGWHHQVWNLDDTISINHNWINGCNIMLIFEALNNNLKSVVKEIEHLKKEDDFDEHCQLMLNTLFGMNHERFYEFLKFIALSRIEMIQNSKSRVLFHGHTIGHNHILFDLIQIQLVLKEFLKCNNIISFKTDIEDTLNQVLSNVEV